MKNCICLASVCLLLLFASGASLGQAPSASPPSRITIGPGPFCPLIVVSSPSVIEVGKPLQFNVGMSGPTPAEPTYTWEVVGGVIAEGQGTAEIKVNVPRTPGPTVTAKVSIGGLDLACSRTASASLSNCGMLQAVAPDGIVSSTKDEARPSVAAALSSPSPAAQNEPCPGISVSCPSDVEVGKPQVFKASVGDSNAKLSYIWEVVGGLLVEGQGTPEIKVNLTRRLDEGVVATLRVCGLDPTCVTTGSCSTAIRQARPTVPPR